MIRDEYMNRDKGCESPGIDMGDKCRDSNRVESDCPFLKVVWQPDEVSGAVAIPHCLKIRR